MSEFSHKKLSVLYGAVLERSVADGLLEPAAQQELLDALRLITQELDSYEEAKQAMEKSRTGMQIQKSTMMPFAKPDSKRKPTEGSSKISASQLAIWKLTW